MKEPTRRTPFGDYYEMKYEGQDIRIIVRPLEKMYQGVKDAHPVDIVGRHPNGQRWVHSLISTKEFLQYTDGDTALDAFYDAWKRSLPK